ncbi:LOW QUALITY PROTEIN: hypothetical protein PHMEG_00029458 [Phytophthora megakarya]|uniref:Uncharacterized protein n=1 Tax=Phytophthora megakarya TaxID=4795 RepID=A0A225V453_9STRA|nr:LOW QUALITY PROTEIN: hypothetical protein PHMEG_00029458 [Phytophthora megakarya]
MLTYHLFVWAIQLHPLPPASSSSPPEASAEGSRSPTPVSSPYSGVSEDSGSTGASSPPPEVSAENPSPTPATELDGGASEGSQLQSSGISRDGDSSGECLPLADTNSRAGGGLDNLRCGASSGGLVEPRGDATELLRSSMCELAKLVVGMARQPPARRFLAAVAPHRLPPQEADALVRLRDEVSRLQTRCEDAERGLANEVQLRIAAEADSVRSTEDFYTMHDANQDLRTENEELVARIRELDITVAEQAHGVQRLKGRFRSSDADCAAAMRYVAQERERMKEARRLQCRSHQAPAPSSGQFCAPAKLCRARPQDTDALILSTAGLSASGLDWELLGLGPDRTGLLRLLSPSSQSEGSADEDSAPPVVEASESPSKASPASGSLDEESAEHSFIRPSSDSSVEPSTEVSVSGLDSGGLFDDEPDKDPPRKRKCLRQNAVVRSAESSSSKLPAARRLGRPSVDLKRKAASAAIPSAIRSGHKKARPSTPVPMGGPSMDKDPHSPPRPILEEGEIADDAGFDPSTEASIGSASARSSPLSAVHVTATSGQSRSAASKSMVDLTIDDTTDLSSKKDSSPFSSPVVSYFPRQDGRQRRSTSVVSELRMRESLERELADDDFMLGLTSEGSVAATSTPPQGKAPAVITPAGAAELSTEKSVVTEPFTADSSVEAQLLNEVDVDLAALGGSNTSVKGSEVDNESSAELGTEVSVEPSTAPVQPAAQPAQATEVSVRSSSRTRRGRSHVIQSDPAPGILPRLWTARRGTDTTTFTPAVAVISRATNLQKLPANAEPFLKPGFTAVGAQKAWCKMLNVSLSAPAPKEHSPPLDFAFLALMHNVRSSRHPWRVLYDRMPDEPLTFSLGKFVKGVRISIRASGLGGLVRMWPPVLRSLL